MWTSGMWTQTRDLPGVPGTLTWWKRMACRATHVSGRAEAGGAACLVDGEPLDAVAVDHRSRTMQSVRPQPPQRSVGHPPMQPRRRQRAMDLLFADEVGDGLPASDRGGR